jgi:alpha-galactosidase
MTRPPVFSRRQLARLLSGASAGLALGAQKRPVPETAFRRAGDNLEWTIGNHSMRQRLALKGGRFCCESLVCAGREWIHPVETSDEFLVQIGDQPVTLTGGGRWRYAGHSIEPREKGWTELRIELQSAGSPATIRRHYWWHDTLPVVRQRIVVRNDSAEPLVVRRIDSFRLRVSPVPQPLELSWMNNFGRGMKPNPGNPIHRRTIGENIEHEIRTGPYSPDCAWFSLEIPGRREGLIGGWEWSGPMRVVFGDLKEPCLIHGGPDPEGMAEPLPPGSMFEAPVGWYGLYRGDLDEAAHVSHRLVRESLGPPLPAKDYPWVAYCTWACSLDEDSPFNEKGTHPWFPTEKNLISQAEAAARLGFELYLWDYGWFPRVGDWWCDPHRFPEGPKRVVRAVKSLNMKLGLWIGFGNADEKSQVVRDHPDWLATYRGKPIPDDFFTRTGASVWNTRILCLAHRPAREWVKQQLSRVIDEFELDWLKHDFDLITICQDRDHTHTPGDGRIAACEGFYEIMDFVRSRYPNLVCENWMNNSAVPDYGVLQRHHMQLIGDAYQPFLLRQMVYGHTQIFPPDRQQRYVRLEESDVDFRTKVRSGMVGGPWTLLSDPRRLSAGHTRILAEEIALLKRWRHLFSTGRVYRLLDRPHPRSWDAFEFYDPRRREGIVYVFRNDHAEAHRMVKLKGLVAGAPYRVTSVDAKSDVVLTGRRLMSEGIPVVVPRRSTSEVLLLKGRRHDSA